MQSAAAENLTPRRLPNAALMARDCSHDNCLRAVIASAFLTRSATADCSSYFLTTVTPATFTTTATVTQPTTTTVFNPPHKRDEGIMLHPRQQTVVPTEIPAYASACSGSVRYSSACSCIGVTAMTTTAPTPTYTTTTTIFTTSTFTTTPPIPTLTILQYDNGVCAGTNSLQYLLPNNECFPSLTSSLLLSPAWPFPSCDESQCTISFFLDSLCEDLYAEFAAETFNTCFELFGPQAMMLQCPC